MLTLALDTTTRAGSVAVVRDSTLLAVVHGDASRTHGERLPAEIARALDEAQLAARDLELLVVASGPGAFTGLRIGLASMQGLAMVLSRPVIAVSALDALALAAEDAQHHTQGGQSPLSERDADFGSQLPIIAWMDAARGEVFAAMYVVTSDPTPASVPLVGTPEVVLQELAIAESATFIGDGAVRYRAQILQHGAHRVLAPPDALAPYIARIGIVRARRGDAGPPHALQPLYVRRPDAELERQRREVR